MGAAAPPALRRINDVDDCAGAFQRGEEQRQAGLGVAPGEQTEQRPTLGRRREPAEEARSEGPAEVNLHLFDRRREHLHLCADRVVLDLAKAHPARQETAEARSDHRHPCLQTLRLAGAVQHDFDAAPHVP